MTLTLDTLDTMPRKKLTAEDIDEMCRQYEAWDPWAPDAMNADELAESFGTSRSTMYRWLKVRGIPLKEGQQSELQPRAAKSGPPEGSWVPKDMFEAAITQVIELRVKNTLLEQELEKVKGSK